MGTSLLESWGEEEIFAVETGKNLKSKRKPRRELCLQKSVEKSVPESKRANVSPAIEEPVTRGMGKYNGMEKHKCDLIA